MKQFKFYLTLFLFQATIVPAQEVKDALLYSIDDLHGTARFRAMSGAFGALGGDFSAISLNPASSSVYNNNQVGISLSNYGTKNKANYYGTKTSENENSLELNQAGGVFLFHNDDPSANWTKIAFAVNYENTRNFDNAQFSAGVNPTRSVAEFFIGNANGTPLDVLENSGYSELNYTEQQAFLGYQGYIINPVSSNSNNTLYTSNVREGGNYYQENGVYSTGYNGKVSFNFSTSYKDKIYVGLNLNSHFTNLLQSSNFYETNSNPLNTDERVQRIRFRNDLFTNGTGFSFQLGTIVKVNKAIRLGFAYESPTWHNLSDETSQRLSAVRVSTLGELNADVIDPNITNFFAPYRLQTPSKYTWSAAYIFGQRGLISIDFSLKDYNNIKFSPSSDSYFRELNAEMSTILKTSSLLRIGAEYKIKALSLRGGYRLEASPYRNIPTIGDLTGYSAGLGYNFGSTKVDFAYTLSQRNLQSNLFNIGLTDTVAIDSRQNNLTLSVIFEL